MDRNIPRDEWVGGLQRVTDRNAGRRTVLEDAADLGAHLTHPVGRPPSIDLLQDPVGRDAGLRTTHDGDGQAVPRLLYES